MYSRINWNIFEYVVITICNQYQFQFMFFILSSSFYFIHLFTTFYAFTFIKHIITHLFKNILITKSSHRFGRKTCFPLLFRIILRPQKCLKACQMKRVRMNVRRPLVKLQGQCMPPPSKGLVHYENARVCHASVYHCCITLSRPLVLIWQHICQNIPLKGHFWGITP